MSTATASVERAAGNRWERNVPVYGFPVVNGFFLGLSALVLVAFVLTAYRELTGLGPVSGMNDAYGWGIWKTFNVMVLTALGSGAFAIGIAAWVFGARDCIRLCEWPCSPASWHTRADFFCSVSTRDVHGTSTGWSFPGNGTCIHRSQKWRSACPSTP